MFLVLLVNIARSRVSHPCCRSFAQPRYETRLRGMEIYVLHERLTLPVQSRYADCIPARETCKPQ